MHDTLLNTIRQLCHLERFRTFYNIYLLSPTQSFDKMVAHRLFCFGCQLIRKTVLFQTEPCNVRSRSSARTTRSCAKEINNVTLLFEQGFKYNKRHFLVAFIIAKEKSQINLFLLCDELKSGTILVKRCFYFTRTRNHASVSYIWA